MNDVNCCLLQLSIYHLCVHRSVDIWESIYYMGNEDLMHTRMYVITQIHEMDYTTAILNERKGYLHPSPRRFLRTQCTPPSAY
jgi:hypothetical protein